MFKASFKVMLGTLFGIKTIVIHAVNCQDSCLMSKECRQTDNVYGRYWMIGIKHGTKSSVVFAFTKHFREYYHEIAEILVNAKIPYTHKFLRYVYFTVMHLVMIFTF